MLSTGLNDPLKKQGGIKRNWNYFLMRGRVLCEVSQMKGFRGT